MAVKRYNGTSWDTVAGAGTPGAAGIVTSATAPSDTSVLWADTTVTTNNALIPAGGTTNQVLTKSSSSDYATTWATPAAGGMTLISETTASALSSLSFTSLGSYKQLLLIWAGVRHSANGSAFSIRLNNNSGSIYPINGFQGDSTFTLNGTTPDTIQGGNNITIFSFGRNVTNASANTDVNGSLLIDNYTSTTKSKYWEIKHAYYDVSSSSYGSLNCQGFFNDTTAITSLDIVRLSGSATFSNQNNTTIRLYGVS
jgi:hypothetical protein